MTKAMEMVSAAKMRRSVLATQKSRLFTALTRQIVAQIPKQQVLNSLPLHPLMIEREEKKKTLLLLITSNRGLCGNFNAAVLKESKAFFAGVPYEALDVLGVGKKSVLFSKRYGYSLIGVYDDFADKPTFESVLPIARQIIDFFISGAYDTVMVGYTHFGSAVSQQVCLRQILPLSLDAIHAYAEKESIKETEITAEYTFEPSYQAVLEEVVPRLVEVLLYQMVLESSASEHSSRMVAMKNATDNANTLVDTLTLTYNKARQAAITQEISEIVGGAAALE